MVQNSQSAVIVIQQSNLHSRKIFIHVYSPVYFLGPVYTNPFSNENGAVLLRFQKDLRPHLSFSYRFARPQGSTIA